MSTMNIYERVAHGELTVEEAVEILLEEDRKAAYARKPSWVPRWLWALTLWWSKNR